jgi:RHH-type proline utilization regulon transcriptional repressor/proline dehydrogenase/delta 1-pyrroline-5-carboxylate dehydrogenase
LAVRDRIGLVGAVDGEVFSVCLVDGDLAADPAAVVRRCRELARREGPIVSLLVGRPAYDLTRLVVERVVSVNTAAVGGNAELLVAD